MDWTQTITILITVIGGFGWMIIRMDRKFDKMEDKFDAINIRLNSIDHRLSILEGIFLGQGINLKIKGE